MNDISRLSHSSGAIGRIGSHRTAMNGGGASPPRLQDSVEVSEAAHLLAKLSELPDVRRDVVDRVRTQIEAGTYESPEKLDAAVESLAEDL